MTGKKEILRLVKKLHAERSLFPRQIEPMLATRAVAAFDDDDWIFEIKWDGYRILAYKKLTKVTLHSRRFQDFTREYATVTGALTAFPYSFVLDGEVIMLDRNGKPSFDELQNVRSAGTDRLVYCVFDILWLEGYSLLGVPLEDRKKILSAIFAVKKKHLLYYPFTVGAGKSLFADMLEQGMEGVVAKKRASVYLPGERTSEWLKIQTRRRQEFVIGGWQESGSGKPFRSLMFGYYDGQGKLRYFGHSGGGYTDKAAADIKKKLLRLAARTNPFSGEVVYTTKPHWVKPRLVAEFEFAGLTSNGRIRKPAIFKGLRTDKDPMTITLDKSFGPGAIQPDQLLNAGSNWPLVEEMQKRASVNELRVGKNMLKLHNVGQLLWQDPPVTKSDLLKYYIDHADLLLPYLRRRPLSLHIKHRGPAAPGMYIKGMEGRAPAWAGTFVMDRKHRKAGKSEKIDYLVCDNIKTLIYAIDLGCIDLNPWNSTVDHPLSPDYLVLDIDPTDDDDFQKVVEVARAARAMLKKLRLSSFPKTSGKTGLHISCRYARFLHSARRG